MPIDTLLKAGQWMSTVLNPAQICISCLIVTLGGGYFAATNFVQADELQSVRQEIRDLAIGSLEEKIIDTRIRECQAQNGQRVFYRQRLTELLRRYQDRTSQAFPLPQCGEL
jgi:hypothetical protein